MFHSEVTAFKAISYKNVPNLSAIDLLSNNVKDLLHHPPRFFSSFLFFFIFLFLLFLFFFYIYMSLCILMPDRRKYRKTASDHIMVSVTSEVLKNYIQFLRKFHRWLKSVDSSKENSQRVQAPVKMTSCYLLTYLLWKTECILQNVLTGILIHQNCRWTLQVVWGQYCIQKLQEMENLPSLGA